MVNYTTIYKYTIYTNFYIELTFANGFIPFAKVIAVKNGTNGAFLLFGLILTSCYLDVLLSCLEKGGMKMSPGIEWE